MRKETHTKSTWEEKWDPRWLKGTQDGQKGHKMDKRDT